MQGKISRKRASLILFWIVVLGAALRSWGISFGLPGLYHADEPIVVNHALSYGLGDFNPHFFNIPPLTSYLLFLVYGFYFLFGFFVGSFTDTNDFLNLFLKDPSSFYLLGRIFIGVIFGAASIVMIYRFFRLITKREVALLGAFLLASLYLPVQLSHFIYPDSPLLFMLIFCMFYYLKITLDGKFKDYAFAILGTGAAIALKYNAAFLIFPFFAAHFYRAIFRSKQLPTWNFLAVPILCGFAMVFVFFLLNPFFFIDFPFAYRELMEQSSATGFTGWLHHITYSLKEGIGLPLFIFFFVSVLSSFFFIFRYPYLLVFYVYLGIFYFHLVLFSQEYGRYGILLVPAVLFFTVFSLNQIYEKYGKGLLILIIALILAAPNFLKDAQLGNILLAKDTRNQAKEWMFKNIPTGSKIFFDIDRFQPRLPFCKEDLYAALAGLDPASAKAKRIRALIDLGAGETCYEVYYRGAKAGEDEVEFSLKGKRIPMDWEVFKKEQIQYVSLTLLHGNYPDPQFLNKINQNGKLIKVFTPYKNKVQNYSSDRIDLTGAPTASQDLAERKSNGHRIEVYRLK